MSLDQYSEEALLEEFSERINRMVKYKTSNDNLLKELQGVNKKLKESEKLKSNFLSNIRNEIINPFTSVLTLSKSIMSSKVLDKEKIEKITTLIYLESFDLDFQFKNIFAAAAIEAGEFYPEYSMVNIPIILSEVVAMFSIKSDQKQISVKLEISDELNSRTFITDSEKFQLVVSNLLSNAIRYSHAGSEVKIMASYSKDVLILIMEDRGVGFDKLSEEILFNRFTQLDYGPTRIYGGHGLGLSVTKSAVDSMNGEINLIGKKNAGCTVTVKLKEYHDDKRIFDQSDSSNELFFNHTEKF